MKLKVSEKNRYLAIPVRRKAEETRIYFYNGDVLLRDIIICVDFEHPDYTAYYDMKTFMGMDITVSCNAGEFKTSDSITYEENDDIRPAYHFSAKAGWINDPNGMIFYEGKYHLFFQYNPVGALRGSEHWGHAVSEDLVHWEEWDIALFPDDMGTMYSGCAIEDKDNILGMKENEHTPLVLFYTASGGRHSVTAKGKPFTQCMAVSVDGGHTFKKYQNNPVIGELSELSRDPNVVYDEESKMFIMALFVDRDYSDNFGLFKSSNLVDWIPISEFTVPGDRVCPDIYTLYDNGKRKWVFSGGNNYYVTADLDLDKGLINMSEPRKFGYGPMFAAQTFHNCDRRIRLAWARLKTGAMAGWGKEADIPTKTYSQFMSIPVEISLKDDILRVAPLIDFEKEVTYRSINPDGMRFPLLKKPMSLYLKAADPTEKFQFELFGNTIKIDGDVLKFSNFLGDEYEMPYEGELKLFADNIGYDIFASDKYYASYQAISKYEKNFLTFEGNVTLEKLEWGWKK